VETTNRVHSRYVIIAVNSVHITYVPLHNQCDGKRKTGCSLTYVITATDHVHMKYDVTALNRVHVKHDATATHVHS